MPRARKKDDPAALPDPLPVAAAATDGEDETDEQVKDKAEALLRHLKEKSSEIVIRQAFTKANPLTGHGVSALLDDACGIDGWAVSYKAFGHDAVVCELAVKVAGQFIAKCGVGFAPPEAAGAGRMKAAVVDSLFAAAAEWGIKRASRAMAENGLDTPKPAEKPKPVGKPADAAREGEACAATDKPADKPKPPEKTAKEIVAERVGAWVQMLAACDTPDAVNKLLPKLKNEPSVAKKEVWDLIGRTCKDADVGWLYDKDKMRFYDPNATADDGIGEAIPF